MGMNFIRLNSVVSLMKSLWRLLLTSLHILDSTAQSFCPYLPRPRGSVVSYWFPANSRGDPWERWASPRKDWNSQGKGCGWESSQGCERGDTHSLLPSESWKLSTSPLLWPPALDIRTSENRNLESMHTCFIGPKIHFFLAGGKGGGYPYSKWRLERCLRRTALAKLILICPGAQLQGLRLQYQEFERQL